MDPEFWKQRWREGRIGFHEGQPNALLINQSERLGEPGRVLVPLSGKSEDLVYLASLGHEVVGIELVEEAVNAFFSEHGLTPDRSKRGELAAYSAGGIHILHGDFFDARPEDLGTVTAFYDRAAIVAFPPEQRPRYTEHLRELVGDGKPGLVVTFDYPQAKMEGPPFSVTEIELRRYYPSVELLSERMTDGPQSRGAGISMFERLYLTKTGPVE